MFKVNKKTYDISQTRQRFSIRKFKFGAASIAIATLMFLGSNAAVSATEITPKTATQGSVLNSEEITTVNNKEDKKQEEISSVSSDLTTNQANSTTETTKKVEKASETESSNNVADDLMSESAPKTTEISDLIKGAQFVTGSDTRDANWKPDDKLEDNSIAKTMAETGKGGITPLNWRSGITEITYSEFKNNDYSTGWSKKPGGNDNYADEIIRVRAQYDKKQDTIHWQIVIKGNASGTFMGVSKDFSRPYNLFTTSRGLHKPENLVVQEVGVDGETLKEKQGYPHNVDNWPSSSRKLYKPTKVNVNGKEVELLGSSSYMMTEWGSRWRLGNTGSNKEQGQKYNIEKHIYYSKYGFEDWLASSSQSGTRIYNFDTKINREELKELGQLPNVDSQFSDYMGWGKRFREDTNLVNKVWVTAGMTSREAGGNSITHPGGRGIYNFSKIATVDVSTLAKDADEYSPQYDNGSGYPNDTVNLKIKEKNNKQIPAGTTYKTEPNSPITVDQNTGEVTVKIPADAKPGSAITGNVTVTYPDGTVDTVPVNVTVKKYPDNIKYSPEAKHRTVEQHAELDAKDSIANTDELPSNSTYKWKDGHKPDTSTSGEKDGIVEVHYPDGTVDDVNVKVTVTSKKTDNTAPKLTVTPEQQTVKVDEDITFTVTVEDENEVALGLDDLKAKYGKDIIAGRVKIEYLTNEANKKVMKVTIMKATLADKGAITFTAKDKAGNQAEPKTVTINVLPLKDKYEPKGKDQTVKVGETPKAEDSIGNVPELPKGTKFEYETPVDTTTPGDKDAKVIVTYPDGSKDEVPVKVHVTKTPTQADSNEPKGKDQTVKVGETPKAEDSIGNVPELPKGTKFEYETPVDTTTPGDKDAKVIVTYPDGSKDEVPVKVHVTKTPTQADSNEPKGKDQTVKVGETPKAEDSIGNVPELPKGTKFEYETPVDTTTPGDKDAKVIVTYPDGSKDEVPVKVHVTKTPTQADSNEPKGKDQTVKVGETPKAEDSIGNVPELPKGTKFEYETPVDTTTPGDKDAKVIVTYPDGSKDEVPVKVHVTKTPTQADSNEPKGKDQTVKVGETPKAEDSIGNVPELPKGTKFEYETPVDTTTPGDKDAKVIVTYPDGSKDEVPVKVHVTKTPTQADSNEPKGKDQTVKVGETPKAEDSIGNVPELPKGTKFEYETPVDTTTPGDKDAKVIVTYPDGSKDEVPVKVHVTKTPTQADSNEPKGKDQTVKVGETPKAEDSIGNVPELPKGTKFEYETPVDTTTPGDKDAKVIVTYPDGSKDEVPVKVHVTKTPTQADSNEPKGKDQTVKVGETPKAEDSIGNVPELPKGTKFEYETPVDTTTPGDKDAKVIVTYPDGSKDEVPVKVHVTKTPTQADSNEPKGKDQTVKVGETPKAEDSIGNVPELPKGTKFEYETPVDTTTPGDKDAKVIVTYPDGSKDEVPVKVHVTKTPTQADSNEPKGKDQTVKVGETPKAEDSIGNVPELPKGTKFEYETPVDTTTPGDKDAKVIVTYPDGSKDEVPVKVHVTKTPTQADSNEPKGKDQTVKVGETPKAEDSIGNVPELPKGTKFEYETPVDTTTPGDKDAKVIVTYPDGSKDEVPVKVHVTKTPTQADSNEPKGKDQTVKVGETPKAEDSIGNVPELPKGTKFEYETPVDTTTPGDKDAKVIVTYPDGSKDEVPVKVHVTKTPTQADSNEPKGKDQTVKVGETPKAEDSIGNVPELPKGTKFEYETPVDTTTPGDKDAKVIVTYPDGSKDEVPVKVHVTKTPTQADSNEPKGKDQTVKVGETPKAEDSIGNVPELPKGTKFEYETPVDTTTPGDKDAKVIVTYPDGSKDEVPVKVHVTKTPTQADSNEPKGKDQTVKVGETPKAEDSIGNVPELPKGTKFEYETPVDTTTPGDKDAKVIVTYPDGSKDEVPVKVHVTKTPTQADSNEPKGKDQTVKVGETPKAEDSIGNVPELPKGTKFEYETPVDTTTPGDKDAKVIVTYPDGSKDEVPVKVHVTKTPTQADSNEPKGKDQTVKVGETPKAEDSIGNVPELPKGTKFEYETPVDTTTPGDKDAKVIVTYPDGSKDEVPVKVHVTKTPTQADSNEPKGKDQTVKVGETPKAEDSIGNVPELPKGTKFEYETPVDTTTPGDKDAKVIVTYPDGSKDEVPVKVHVTKTPTQADSNEPKGKDQTVKVGETPKAEDSIGNVPELPKGTKFEYETPVDTTTPGDKDAKVIVTYPDGSKDEVPVKVHVTKTPTQADSNEPKGKDQTVKVGETPKAEDSIGNVPELPKGTKFEYETPVDTTTPGDKDAKVIVTYPDGSKDEVPVKVHVTKTPTQADSNEPKGKDQTVKVGETPKAEDSIGNVPELPKGTKFEYETPVDTTTPGDKDAKVIVTYPDGSKDEVPVKVHVTKTPTQADSNEPKGKDQTVKVGETPKAEDSIGNVPELPKGTKFEYETPVDTTTPGDKDAKVIVTYPDGSKDEVPVKVHVTKTPTQADSNEPKGKDQTVKVGETPKAEDSIGNVPELPKGTKFEYETPVDTTTPGDKDAKVIVTYPDGSKDEVPVKVHVTKTPTQADSNEPKGKDQTVKVGETPKAEDSIGNVPELPKGTKFEYETPVDTTTPGDKDAKVIVTYPDGSKDEVPVKVHVTKTPTQADSNEPKGKDQTENQSNTNSGTKALPNTGETNSPFFTAAAMAVIVSTGVLYGLARNKKSEETE